VHWGYFREVPRLYCLERRNWNWPWQSPSRNPNAPSEKLKRTVGFARKAGLYKAVHIKFIRKYQLFIRLLKKRHTLHLESSLSNAFESIKQYLTRPLVLMAPVQGRPLILYTATFKWSLGAILSQFNDERKEHSLDYISRTMVGAEINYSSMEKISLVLVFDV